jgi:hypothetical protein
MIRLDGRRRLVFIIVELSNLNTYTQIYTLKLVHISKTTLLISGSSYITPSIPKLRVMGAVTFLRMPTCVISYDECILPEGQ